MFNIFSYTALSRAMRLSGVYIIDFHPDTIYANKTCIDEYNRLRRLSNMAPLDKENVQPPIANIFKKKAKFVKVDLPANEVMK
jgi:hypothetical protein